MPAPALVAHLSTAELGQRYRAARQPIERSHLQIVWLLSQGRSERDVAAISGYGQDDDLKRSSEAGFDHHLVKPVDGAVLRKLIAEVSGRLGRGADAE